MNPIETTKEISFLPLRSGSACSSTSCPPLYLDDPWLLFCFFFIDLLAKGSIRSTKVPEADEPDPDPDPDPPEALLLVPEPEPDDEPAVEDISITF